MTVIPNPYATGRRAIVYTQKGPVIGVRNKNQASNKNLLAEHSFQLLWIKRTVWRKINRVKQHKPESCDTRSLGLLFTVLRCGTAEAELLCTSHPVPQRTQCRTGGDQRGRRTTTTVSLSSNNFRPLSWKKSIEKLLRETTTRKPDHHPPAANRSIRVEAQVSKLKPVVDWEQKKESGPSFIGDSAAYLVPTICKVVNYKVELRSNGTVQ